MANTAHHKHTINRTTDLLVGTLLWLALLSMAMPSYSNSDKTDQDKKYVRSEHSYQIPDVDLITMNGDRISLISLLHADEKPLLLNFIFTSCPGICPVMSATFSRFQQELGVEAMRQVRMLSISIDPEYDTPEVLREYAGTYRAGPQWQFLTGSLKDVIAVQKAFNSYFGSKMSHDPLTFLRAAPDTPWIRLQGLTRVSDLIGEYQMLAASATARIDAQQAIELGRRIYQDGILPSGEPLQAMVQGDIPVSGTQLNCLQCHQRSGLGSSEGRRLIPPISGQVLYQPRYPGNWQLNFDLVIGPDPRPAYDDRSLRQAISTGIAASGRTLDLMMPRYQLSDENAGYLLTYLKTLSSNRTAGVTDKHINFASLITEGSDPRQRKAMMDVFQTFLNDKNRGYRFEHAWAQNPLFFKERKQRAFREWVVHLWYLQGPPETWRAQLQAYYRQQPVFALLSGVTSGAWQPIHEFCETRQLPCLFPNTDLPVISDTDFYTVYFSKGMTLEAQVLHRYLEQQTTGSGYIVQIYRENSPGADAAEVLRLQQEGGNLIDKAIGSDQVLNETIWQREIAADRKAGTSLIMWLDDEDSTYLLAKPGLFAQYDRVYLSSSLTGDITATIPHELSDKLYFIHPFALPRSPGQGVIRTTAWLRVKQVPVTDIRIQANTLTALTMTNAALTHMIDYFSREYFLEKIEHAADDFLTTSVYERLSLGPGQRFASKGAYVARLSHQTIPQLEAVSEWIIP
jgi:cytochrome oxidase Cu insertion factor (SCO1/SenC/PrrC family)